MSPIGSVADRVKKEICKVVKEMAVVDGRQIHIIGGAHEVIRQKIEEIREKDLLPGVEVTIDVVEAQLKVAVEAQRDLELLINQALKDYTALKKKVCG